MTTNQRLIPGYETTYQHHYKPYFLFDTKDTWLEKKILQLSDLETKMGCNQTKSKCTCDEVAKIKEDSKFSCDPRAWEYLAKSKSEYKDEFGRLWPGYPKMSGFPKKISTASKTELTELMPPEPSYLSLPILEQYERPHHGLWWVENLQFNPDLQCRIARSFQSRQAYFGEKKRIMPY